ncbi:hypothetical protein [Burkholderia diffusa]|uniref:hypothetical protein n=1 Tax=Burkholderia diffusa TaxID=488732 RepID=UPI001E5F441C|nr:hypothetical protein [Burkholderia diffusa]
MATAAGLVVFLLARVFVAAENRANGRSQRLDFFLGMGESRAAGSRDSMRRSRALDGGRM